MAAIKKFEEIEAWQIARELCNNIYHAIMSDEKFSHDYSLRNQIDKASGSVMDNIAEGFERGGNKEFIHFLSISKASAAEVQSQLYRALDRGHITQNQFKEMYNKTDVVKNKIGGFMSYLKKSSFKGSKFLKMIFSF